MILPPTDFGAPAAFPTWNPGQGEAYLAVLNTIKRFPVAVLPTGIGKSLIAVLAGYATGKRTVILTATKGLQQQYVDAFRSMGLRNVWGMGNYDCNEEPSQKASEAGCLDGWNCPRRQDGGCDFYDAVKLGSSAEVVVTNYAFWLNHHEGLGKRDLLVCDEAHAAAAQITNYLRIELAEAEVNMPRGKQSWEQWQAWARTAAQVHKEKLDKMRPTRARRTFRKLYERLDSLASAQGAWVAERTPYGYAFEPLWPGPYAEQLLFRKIPKVLLTSATMSKEELRYLGLSESDYEWIEAPSPFPISSRPVLWSPSGVQVRYDMPEHKLRDWLRHIDRLVEVWLAHKGIIHTVSYQRAQDIKQESEWRDLMLMPNSRNTASAVAEFKRLAPPAVLISPAVDTGWDFPAEDARYQIIAKLPYPPVAGSAILQARCEDDPGYRAHYTMSKLVQMAGRIVRGMGDWGVTLIVDDSIGYFMRDHGHRAPLWFRQAYRRSNDIPQPPK